jgi:CheY-like chemotaxis protein
MRLRGTTVLLVEDDLDNLELLSMCLEGEGAHVLPARSVAAALVMSAAGRIDIVVTDLDLPDGDGCALVGQLRSRDGLRRLPAIAVSGYSQEQWRSQAARSGFERYVVKPFPIDSLINAIASLKGGGGDDQNAMA